MTAPIFNDVLVAQNPITIIEGSTKTYGVPYPDTVSLSNSAMYAYRGTKDESATVLSGSLQASGNILILKTISNLRGGSEYFIVWACTCQGQVEYFGAKIIVLRKNGR